MAEMSDADVFGTNSPAPLQEMSDADVFSAVKPTAAPSRPMSDNEVGISTPGVVDYLGEVGKQVAHGGVDALITSRLRGVAGQIYEPDTSRQIPAPPPGGYRTEADVPELPVLPVKESTPYRAAEAVEGFMKSTLPDQNILNPVVRDVSSGVGSVAGNIAGLLVPGTRGFGISTTPLSGAGESVERAVKADATDDQIRRAAAFGNIAGVTEFADAALVFLGTPGKVTGMIAKVGLRTMQGAFIEGGTEGLQQLIQNAIAKGIYNPKQDLIDYGGDHSVAYAAMIGMIVGGGVSAAVGRDGQTAPSTPPTPESLAAASAPIGVEAPVAAPVEPTVPQVTPTPLPSVYDDVIVGEPPIPPTTEEVKAKTLSSDIVDHIQKNMPPEPLALPTDPSQLTFENLIAPTKEEITSSPGANTARLAKLLGPKLYGDPSNITSVSVKEMFQNSFDAIKAMMEQGKIEEGNIDITMSPRSRTISIVDNGSGMTPQVLGKQFLEIAGTQKESKRASGGLGIAKMLFIFGNKNLKVTTLRDGKVSELITTGEQLFSSLDDKSKAPQIQIRSATTADQRIFPNGHGTRVEVTVPESYIDPSTGESKAIGFDSWEHNHPVLVNSPLFGNIKARLNGQELSLGANFPLEDYTQLGNVNFSWGTARIYITKEPNGKEWENNVHVLSNGLWQFSGEIKADLRKPYGKNIPYNIYIDVNPKAAPEEPGYPFDLNRQGFSPQSKKDFANIFNYIGLLYQQNDMANSASNFGTMQFLDYDTEKKTITASPNVDITPKMPNVTNPFSDVLARMRKGKSFKVVDGSLIIDGVKAPELNPKDVENFTINTDELMIDQNEIDPERIILHDNVIITVSESETRTVTDYGRERFGKRFDEFVFSLGAAFKELRDVVVKGMPREQRQDMETPPLGLSERALALWTRVRNKEQPNGYEDLGKEGIGISFDREYRGVSIKLPFSGMFLNPVVPEYSDQLRAAVGMVGTMVHELAHYKVRSHDQHFPAEMQRIIIMLDTHPEFNYHAFKQKVINIVAAYNDVFSHMNGVFTSGDFTIQPRGKRFKDSGSNEARDGDTSSDLARFGSESESGSRLSDWVAKSETIPEAGSRRGEPAYQTGRSGNDRPADNGRARNYNALKHVDAGITAPPQQPEVNALRDRATKVLGSPLPPEVKEAASHADRMNWFYKLFAGLNELLDANPHHIPLREYTEDVRAMHNAETKVHDATIKIMKEWRGLGDQAKNLNNLIIDVQAMDYLTSGEKTLNAWRHPTPAEFNAIALKNKVSDEALQVYNKIRQLDDAFLSLVEQNGVDAAVRSIVDPVRLAARIDEIRAQGRLARSQPFFPFTRFGHHYVMVVDAAGKVTSFETFEPSRFVGVSVKRAARYQAARVKELERKVPPGHKVTSGILPETSGPLIGMPTVLLQTMRGEDFGFSVEQIEAIQKLQVARNPAMALNKRSVYRSESDKIPGHSDDLQRSFAKYYFYGGRYFAKTKYSWALRQHIGKSQLMPGNKSGMITTYMMDHLNNNILDTRGDFGFFKGFIFLHAMGYSVAAATQNLTQTPMVTFPFLSGKFGEHKAIPAIIKAMGQVSSFYKKPSYDTMSDFDMKALSYGIKTGRISETQAPELAGIASGTNLLLGQGGTRLQQNAVLFQERAAWMFEMAEQFNRRVAYRAALNLGLNNPNAKFVNESVSKYQDEYKALVAEFGNEPQARAVVTAIHATDQTQFIYSRWARPKIFRGLGSILFVFKRYIQSLMMMLGHNKSDVLPRYVIMMMLIGGLGGLPGYEDLKGILRALAHRIFGKDFNLDRSIREFVLQNFNGTIPPDMVLHGLARRGFGIPALMDMLGAAPGRGLSATHSQNVPYPILDRSRAVGPGTILPFDIGKAMEPTEKLERTIADQTQKASGAVFSVGFNMYKSIMDHDRPASDKKRWEPMMPRVLSSASRGYRAFTEGRERGRGGPNSAPTIVPYDIRDTEQMFEALALFGGYQPLRQQQKWDRIIAEAEIKAFYDFRRKGLLEQYFEASKGRNPDEIAKVKSEIIKFNTELPSFVKSKAISGDTVLRSMKTRERSLQSKEVGIPTQKSNIGISRHVDSLFPESTIDVRKVR